MLNLSLPRCQTQLLKALVTSRSWKSPLCSKIGFIFPEHPHSVRASCQSESRSADLSEKASIGWQGSESENMNGMGSRTLMEEAVGGHANAASSQCGESGEAMHTKLEGLKLSRTAYDQVTPFCVVNFYHLTVLEDPNKVVSVHRKYLEQKDIRGRIWVSSQGINAQYGGPRADAVEYAEWVAQQAEFQGLRWSVWPADGHMFPKLRLKHKPNLISLAGGMTGLPVHDPSSRATPVAPEDWKKMLMEAKAVNQAGHQGGNGQGKGVVILDVRNDYEWDAGHFEGAPRPDEEEFAETPTVLDQKDVPTPLQGVPKDTKVMMYCTGGIRCDVYSTLLKRKGFNNLYTLEGGIQNYLRQEGADLWNGSLFVFDGRMALPAAPASSEALDSPTALPAAIPCQLCGSEDTELPHMNCANIDCNELFIACPSCKTRWNGCCCEACMKAPRLVRPVQLDGGRFGAWGNYVDPDEWHPLIANGRSPEGRVARRERRRRAAQASRAKLIEERNARKLLMRSVMAELAKKAADKQHEAAARQEAVQSGQTKQMAARDS